jgi:polysaccharide export outer membrane protein
MVLGVALAQEPVKTVVADPPVTQPGTTSAEARNAVDSKPAGSRSSGVSGTTTAADAAGMPNGEGGYRIGPEDVLQIDVWKESDFSATTPVRADGKISVPLLNDVQAAGLTPIELSASLREKLSKYVIDPRITVIVTQTNSRKAYVMGMVNRQGTVRLLSNLTVLQAISASGGLAQFAKSKQIYVLREEGGQQRRLPFNYDAVIKGKHPEQNILLQPGDTVVVP